MFPRIYVVYHVVVISLLVIKLELETWDHILLARRSAEFIIKKLQLIAKNFESPRQVSQVNKA